MSWFGRKKRENTAAENTPSPRPTDVAPAPFAEVEGDIVEHATGSLDSLEPDTGSFHVRVNDDTHPGSLGEQVGEIAAESDEDPLQSGLMPVRVEEPTREEMLDEAIAQWRHSLADLDSGHDFLTDMRSGVHLDLTHSHPQGLAHLLATRSATRLSSLVREPDAFAHARETARHIRDTAQAHAEERGLTTCYLGIGEATWCGPAGRDIHAPILVRPLTLNLRGSARDDVDLALDLAADLNPVVLRALRDEGVVIDARALLDLTRSHHGFDPQPVLEAFRSLGEPLPGFRISHALVVGTLVDASGPLVEDFELSSTDLAAHPLIAALAGDADAVGTLAEPLTEREADGIESDLQPAPPAVAAISDDEPVAFADPDARAIHEALDTRAALAVHTPPGSPTTQTLVAYVGEELARGQRVLLLSQRASTLNDLRAHVDAAGLSDAMLSLIPDPHLQRSASKAMLHSLAQASSFVAPESVEEPDGLQEARDVLTGHVEAMHRLQEPWGVTAHEAINALADLSRRRPAPRTGVRLSPDTAERMITQGEEYRALLRDADASGALSMTAEDTAWYGASITSETQAARALELVTHLDSTLVPTLREDARACGKPVNMREPDTLAQLRTMVRVFADMRDLFDRVRSEIFHEDIESMIAAVQDKHYRAKHSIEMSFGERRRWKKLARDLMQPSVNNDDIPALLERSLEIRDRWRSFGPSTGVGPFIPENLDAASTHCAKAEKACDELRVLLAGTPEGTDFETLTFAQLGERMHALVEGREILEVLPRRTSLLRALTFEGFGQLVNDLRERNVSGDLVLAELELSWWVSVLEFIARAEPTLSQYDGTKLSQVAERYRRLDSDYLRTGRYRVRALIDEVLVETMKQYPDTSRAAIRELNGGGAASVKDTAAKYQDIMFRARPLWLASPYMVPQMIPAGEHFDLVVFTDAGTLPTAAAVPAIARARRTVVAGDPFEYATPAPDSHPAGHTSLLDDVSAIAPILRLTHDQHPATGGVRRFVGAVAEHTHEQWAQLSAPPSPEQGDDDTYVYVPDGRAGVEPGTDYIESTPAELQRVSDLVIYHVRHTPERSLAIITLTPEHARRVFDYVMRAVSALPDLADFFSTDTNEYFTVVPVEYARTLVRDDIIVSLGFGLTPHDRLLHRFGPLTGEHGRRALVSALTRARGRTCVVSAVRSSDIDPERLRGEGPEDYRVLLQFLESGMDPRFTFEGLEAGEGQAPSAAEDSSPAAPETPATPDSSGVLVADLADRLWRHGYTVELDYGLTRERIELAVGHPDLPGRYLVAVMTDGPRYREIPDQRERDRLAAERLEAAGWTVERVWSWALFIDPDGEAERVTKTIERAYQAYLDHQDELRLRGGSPRHRLPRPKVPAGHPLSFYGPDDFDAVVAYICSDGKARLADQLAAEVRDFLAFDSRTVLLDVSISAAIRRYQEAQQVQQ